MSSPAPRMGRFIRHLPSRWALFRQQLRAIIIFNNAATYTHALYVRAGTQWRGGGGGGRPPPPPLSHLVRIMRVELLLFVLHTPLSGRKRSIRVAHCQPKLGHLMDSSLGVCVLVSTCVSSSKWTPNYSRKGKLLLVCDCMRPLG